MKVIDHVNQAINKYPSLYMYDNYDESFFAVLHHCFIVLGNGMEWAYTGDPKTGGYMVYPRYRKLHGKWTRIKDKPYGKEKCELDPRIFKEKLFYFEEIDTERSTRGFMIPKYISGDNSEVFESELEGLKKKFKVCGLEEKYIPGVHTHYYFSAGTEGRSQRTNPYPYFEKSHSPFWEIEPNLIQEDWRIAGIEHLKFWREYFNDKKRAKGYHYHKNSEGFKKYIFEQYRDRAKEGMDWVQAVRHDYEVQEFNGTNFAEITNIRWKKELQRTKEFLLETLERLERCGVEK